MALTMGGDEIKVQANMQTETLEALLQRVMTDGKIDKKELQDILARKDIETVDVTNITKEALNKLKKEGLEDILKNGLTLKYGEDSIMEELKKQNYVLSPEVEGKFKSNESFVVTLEGNKVVIETFSFLKSSNDDSASIRKESKREGVESNSQSLDTKKKADAIVGKSVEEGQGSDSTEQFTFRSKQERLGHLLFLSGKDPQIVKKAGFENIDALRKAQMDASIGTEKIFDTMKMVQAKSGQSAESMKVPDIKDGTLSKYLFKTENERKIYLKNFGLTEKLAAESVIISPVVGSVKPPAEVVSKNIEADSLLKIAETLKNTNATKQVKDNADLIQSELEKAPNKSAVKDIVKILVDPKKTNKDFQKSLGVEEDGIIGRLTINALSTKAGSTFKLEKLEITKTSSEVISTFEASVPVVSVSSDVAPTPIVTSKVESSEEKILSLAEVKKLSPDEIKAKFTGGNVECNKVEYIPATNSYKLDLYYMVKRDYGDYSMRSEAPLIVTRDQLE